MTAGLPDALQDAIDVVIAGVAPAALVAAAATLVDDYAHGRPSAVADEAWQAAYLAVRVPATYAAVRAALARVPDEALAGVTTLLDLGAGPGTATWAALSRCAAIDAVTQVDRSRAFLESGARLAPAAADGRNVSLEQRVADVTAMREWPATDLVLSAYALAELAPTARAALVTSAWTAATRLLVIVEPGTPAGFGHIHEARAALMARGAHILAPCPHDGPCPMRDGGRRDDWCHFAVRLPRTRRHRQLKGGTLGYEDEKFAYLVASRVAAPERAAARVLRHPRVEKGRITLTLCTEPGVARQVVTRRDELAWRAARKADWGDPW